MSTTPLDPATIDKTAPVQTTSRTHPSKGARIPWAIHMRAYEVYSAVYAPQQAMIEGGCRGGFGNGELIALLYAGNFSRDQWEGRFEEALKGMDIR